MLKGERVAYLYALVRQESWAGGGRHLAGCMLAQSSKAH